ncbi:alpha/beta hydrolase family protein [Nocardioides pacificus]
MRLRPLLATGALTALLAASTSIVTTPSIAVATAGPLPATSATSVATVATAAAAAAPQVRVTNGCLDGVPDPGTPEKVKICYTLFKPARATARRKAPVVMHSHGWAGSRTRDAASFRTWLSRGYGVLTFDQRGFGESGGRAHVENPDLEGRDVQALVRLISTQRWVRKDGPGDPRLGAIGGSYGGGYQFVGAFRNLMTRGKPVFDALAPEITWHDLNQSLAPEGVVRGEWALALGAAGAGDLPPEVLVALGQGVATGQWPDGSPPGTPDMVRFFERNGPRWHVQQGRRLDIPVLFGQGTTDTLFNLQQGLANWQRALTPRARRHSIFVGYNGGHVLPAILPQGVGSTADPCSRRLAGGSFSDLAVRFMDEKLRGRRTGLRGYGRVHLSTAAGRCTTVSSVAPNTTYDVGTLGTTSGVGVPVSVKVADGPIRVAGTPHLTGRLTALGVDNRAFYALAIGTSPLDAKVVQNNVLPINEPTPVNGERRRIALPSVAVDVPAGQSLFVLVTPISDTFVLMGSRTPGAVVLEGTRVHLPVVRK